MYRRLKEIRRVLGLSQQEVADETGMQQKTISDIENGKVVNIPHSYILYFIEKKVSVEWIYTGQGEIRKQEKTLFNEQNQPSGTDCRNTIANLERLIKSQQETIEALKGNIGSLNYIVNQLEKKMEKD